jgi:hypothetical protein
MRLITLFAGLIFLSGCVPEDHQPAATGLFDYESSDAGREMVFFDVFEQHWRDDRGICKTCTPDRKFYSDGSMSLDENTAVIWTGLNLVLLNDAGDPPPEKEVANLLQEHYAEGSGQFPVRVRENGGAFYILVPVDRGYPIPDFLARDGYLRAYYEIPHVWNSDEW